MKAKVANLRRLNVTGTADRLSDREILTETVKRWRQRLGYCSIVAAVPAILAYQVAEAISDEPKKPEASFVGRRLKLLERLNNIGRSTPALLKRQSEFRLPHQNGSLAPLAGNDECQAIAGGTYTAAAPYVDSGNTTGANNTVGAICADNYCYSFLDTAGPDQIYSFTLMALGANPRIEVTATSATYDPLIYILDYLGCPSGTNIIPIGSNLLRVSSSPGDTETIYLNSDLFLGRPLSLFVDSARNDASGSGPYTIRIQDVTIAPTCPRPNSIDCPEPFVRQHYLDFLNREPDAAGFAFWSNEIISCGGDAQCIEVKRINDSGAFFLSIEFQETGYLVYRFYKASYGNLTGAPVPVRLSEFLPDTQKLGRGVIVNQAGWETVLENNKQAFSAEFVQRSRFTSAYPTSLTPVQFIDALFLNAEVTPSATDRAAAINEFGFAATTADVAARARAMRRVAENSTLAQQDFNRAFVLMQYFGYLRRNPNDAPEPTLDYQGYNFWLNKLNQFNSDFVQAEMVKAFITSGEYRQRFGP